MKFLQVKSWHMALTLCIADAQCKSSQRELRAGRTATLSTVAPTLTQDPQWVPETLDSTTSHINHVYSCLYNKVQFLH